MRKIISIFSFLGILACNSDSLREIDGSVELKVCSEIEPNRNIIAEFTDEVGFIIGPNEECPVFTIEGGPDHPNRNLRFLAPCNLPENFEENNLKIIFSGYLYETFETEDLCAQAFELTDITVL